MRIDDKFTLFHLRIKSHSVTIQMKTSLTETLQRTLCTVYYTLYETWDFTKGNLDFLTFLLWYLLGRKVL